MDDCARDDTVVGGVSRVVRVVRVPGKPAEDENPIGPRAFGSLLTHVQAVSNLRLVWTLATSPARRSVESA